MYRFASQALARSSWDLVTACCNALKTGIVLEAGMACQTPQMLGHHPGDICINTSANDINHILHKTEWDTVQSRGALEYDSGIEGPLAVSMNG